MTDGPMKSAVQVTMQGEHEIVMTRVFDAPRHLVFDAWTKPELLKRWLTGPPGWSMPVCEVDLRVGGRYRYVWRHAGKPEMGMGGVYREIIVPERIVSTELFDQDWTGGETVGTLMLIEKDGRTTSMSTVLYSSSEVRDAVIKSGMAEGVGASYDRLAELLASQRAQGAGQ